MPCGNEAVDTVFAVGGCDPWEKSPRRIQFSPDGQFEDCELICMHSKREEKGRRSAQPRLAGVPLLVDSHNRPQLTIQGCGFEHYLLHDQNWAALRICADV
jgi:hypothetical protein